MNDIKILRQNNTVLDIDNKKLTKYQTNAKWEIILLRGKFTAKVAENSKLTARGTGQLTQLAVIGQDLSAVHCFVGFHQKHLFPLL